MSATDPRFREAVTAAKAGRRTEARNLLLALVDDDPYHELAWLWLSDLVEGLDDKIVALENALTINPNRSAVKARLTRLRQQQQKQVSFVQPPPQEDERLAQGRRHEAAGNWKAAVKAYRRAARNAPTNADRLIARKRLETAEKQYRQSQIKGTRPAATVVRLAVGPFLVYGLLILIQIGLNPLHTSPLYCLNGTLLLFGGFLMTASTHLRQHRLWQQLLGQKRLEGRLRTGVRVVGVLLTIIPFVLLLLQALSRLDAFQIAMSAG